MEAVARAGRRAVPASADASPAPPAAAPAATLMKRVDVVLGQQLIPRALVLGERRWAREADQVGGGATGAHSPRLVAIYATLAGEDVTLHDGDAVPVAIQMGGAGAVHGHALVRLARAPGAAVARHAITAWIDDASRAVFGAALWPR